LFGKFKTKGNAAAQPGLNLLLIMSAFCVIFGALSGNYFGIAIESLPAPLRGLTSDYMTGKTPEGIWNSDLAANHIMFICFAIGTFHLTLAHGWNLIRKINSWTALADLGWLCCTWMLFSVVLNMVLYIELPSWVTAIQLPLLGTGIGLIVLSLVLTKSYFGLVTLALDVINNFVDIISYVRLYAVGAASLAIAQAFNGMAMDMGFNGFASIGAALILFAGHALNIILGAMGVMVHGIRLNTLEFSSHAGVEWAGIHFKPFRKNSDNL
jgi:V/A-type H+-transporting ATPase subunit I